MGRVPLLKHLLEEPGESENLQILYRNVSVNYTQLCPFHSIILVQLRKGADNARGDDTGKLKAAVVLWVDIMVGPSIPPLRTDSKVERGLDNDNTGRLLCPGEYSWDDLR